MEAKFLGELVLFLEKNVPKFAAKSATDTARTKWADTAANAETDFFGGPDGATSSTSAVSGGLGAAGDKTAESPPIDAG